MKKLMASAFVLGMLGSASVSADTLDDVIDRGELRCGVVLDFPPMGYRDQNNNPAGFDVEYCKDLAKALDVDAKITPLTFAERIPYIVTNAGDVVFGGTSDSLERAKTVGFSIPYAVFFAQAIINKDSAIESFEDLRGKRVAASTGSIPEIEWLKIAEEWGEERSYQSYQSESGVFLATAQGKVDAGLTTNTAVKAVVEQYEELVPGPRMPWATDYTSIAAPRKDVTWLNYLNLFVSQQVRSGRYQELWQEYVGTEAPDLTVPKVYY